MPVQNFVTPSKAYPPLGEAASILLRVLAEVKRDTLAEFTLAVNAWNDGVLERLAGLVLTDDQLELLEEFNDELHLVDRKRKITLMVCLVCHGWLPVEGSGRAEMRCVATSGCEGKMVRSVAAKKTPTETSDRDDAAVDTQEGLFDPEAA